MTDEDYLAQLRRSYPRRRLWAVVYLLVGLLFAGGAFWFARDLTRPSPEQPFVRDLLERAQEVDDRSGDGGPLTSIIFVLGALTGIFCWCGAIVGALGLRMLLTRDRRTELLLSLSGRREEEPEQPSAPSDD